jgi:hypothetical protein
LTGTFNVLGAVQQMQLFAMQRTAQSIALSQSRLATGQRLNSALENPDSYFTAVSLGAEAGKLNSLLDGLSRNIKILKAGDAGQKALDNLLTKALSTAENARKTLLENRKDIGEVILADAPVIYYRLNETSGTAAINEGSGGGALNGTYNGGVQQNAGGLSFNLSYYSARFDGVSDRIDIPNSNQINTSAVSARTVELTFQAENLGGKQVLFEEGGGTNAIAMYLDGERIYYAARDAGDFGPFDISAPVKEGRTYHASFVFDASALTFTGYLDGKVVGVGIPNGTLAAHSGAVAIGRNSGGTYFHDGANSGNGEYFAGRISDFALYNSALSQNDLRKRVDNLQLQRAENFGGQVRSILSGIDKVVDDAYLLGTNFLKGDSLQTRLNIDGSSSLTTKGKNFRESAFDFQTYDYSGFAGIQQSITDIGDAQNDVRAFGRRLSSDLAIVQDRKSFTEEGITHYENGQDDLLAVDAEAEKANIKSLQLKQELQVTNLSLSLQGSNIGDFLAIDPLFLSFGSFLIDS